jgi:hypothetical protein
LLGEQKLRVENFTSLSFTKRYAFASFLTEFNFIAVQLYREDIFRQEDLVFAKPIVPLQLANEKSGDYCIRMAEKSD